MTRTGIRAGTAGAAVALALGLAVAGRAEALQPLAENRYVVDRLFAARVADRIRTTCPTISARFLRALAEMNALESYARAQGYSRDTVRAFLKDKAARAEIYDRADAYRADKGAVADDPESFCRLGRAEIAAGGLIGSLLRSN